MTMSAFQGMLIIALLGVIVVLLCIIIGKMR
jgi:hypothetical protein